MKTIIKSRWLIIILWAVATIALTIFTPNLDQIIDQRGNMTMDQSYPSQAAQKMIDGMSTTKGNTGIFVFYDKNTLSDQDMNEIESALKDLKGDKRALGITDILDSFDTPEAKSQLVSKDNTTMLAQFTYEKDGSDTETFVNKVDSKLQNLKVSHYVTGSDFISNDYLKQTNSGVEKSAIITVLFILIVLVVMFRSVITPLVSLLSVGIAYLTSMGIVGQLIDKLGFPVTSLTRMFLILILFGIGTDYNILLFNRFKEEMKKHINIDDAISATFKTAGKTVVFSAATIFIAFMALNFVKFSVYRSGVAVAVGILVLVVELLTLTPALFRILGKGMFWPSRNVAEHRQSKIWEKASSFSTKRPAIVIAAIAILILPVILIGTYKLSFDNLQDMDNSSPSVMGFNTVSEHFNKGTTMPTTVVIQSVSAMDNSTSLAAIDSLTEKIRNIKGVNSVMGPTQPTGEEISDLYSGNQLGQVVSGMNSANGGLSQISAGLDTMKSKLTVPDFSKVTQLTDSTTKIESGMQSLTNAMKQLQSGVSSGASGATSIAQSIGQIKSSLSTVKGTIDQLNGGYSGLYSGLTTMKPNFSATEQGISQVAQLATGIQQAVAQLGTENSSLKNDPTYITLQKEAESLSSLASLDAGMKAMNTGLFSTNASDNSILYNLGLLNGGLVQISDGISKMEDGLDQLQSGEEALAQGLSQGSSGQSVIASNMQQLTDGLGQLSAGQQQLTGGLSTVGDSLSLLKNGIGASSDGIKKVSAGIGQSNDFLTTMESVKSFNIPDEALKSADFKKSLDSYMSSDRKTVKLTVTLNDDPYSDSAISTVNDINKFMSESLQGTALKDAKYAIGGQTSATNDLHGIATSDMATTQVIVLIGIFIVLVLVIKSFWIPVYIIGSLLLSFYSSISLTSLFTKIFLHTSEITWNVPFFGFVMIVALGVDYSIFLMTRYREYRHVKPHEGIVLASANVGGVVLSAALILAGTFATLIPSGLKTLVELAVCVVLGIFILSIILLPIVIPSLISIQDFFVKRYSYDQTDEVGISAKKEETR
jgi:putative drug exporter of the RND superfamily